MTTYRVLAALINERFGPVVVEEVTIAPPGPGEVMVRIQAAGICHTDLTANRDQSVFPLVLGHEGTGIVVEGGVGVSSLQPGTTVALSWKVPCGNCHACRRGRQPWCEAPVGTAQARVHRFRDGVPIVLCWPKSPSDSVNRREEQ